MTPNWYVITGGPSSGKSTLLAELKKLGHITFPEAARVLIDEGLARGETIEQIRQDEYDFQLKTLYKKAEVEQSHDTASLSFFDRGMHDTLAYFEQYGWEVTKDVKGLVDHATYKAVFVLDMLDSFEQDYARTEDYDFAKNLSELLVKAYEKAGLTLVRVPIMPIKQRTQFILDSIKKYETGESA